MRSHFLFALFCILSAPALAADVAQVMDISASEAIEEEQILELDTILKSIPKPENPDEDKNTAKKTDAPDNNSSENNIVVLRGLNKVIGRISTLDAPLGTVTNFENLEIIARKCWKAPPEDRPENAALLEVREARAGEAPKQIFLGWMFSSSPALSSLEHPVYDITILSCEYRKDLEN